MKNNNTKYKSLAGGLRAEQNFSKREQEGRKYKSFGGATNRTQGSDFGNVQTRVGIQVLRMYPCQVITGKWKDQEDPGLNQQHALILRLGHEQKAFWGGEE